MGPLLVSVFSFGIPSAICVLLIVLGARGRAFDSAQGNRVTLCIGVVSAVVGLGTLVWHIAWAPYEFGVVQGLCHGSIGTTVCLFAALALCFSIAGFKASSKTRSIAQWLLASVWLLMAVTWVFYFVLSPWIFGPESMVPQSVPHPSWPTDADIENMDVERRAIHLIHKGKYDRVILETSRELDLPAVDPKRTYHLLLDRSIAYERKGEFQKAIADLKRIGREQEILFQPEPWESLANLYKKAGDAENAAKWKDIHDRIYDASTEEKRMTLERDIKRLLEEK